MKMKKALSILLMLSMLVGVFSVTVSARDQDWRIDDTFTLGDVNGDGYVDAVDAFDVVRYLVDADGASLNRDAADMDADGDITTADSLQFRLCLAEVKQWSDYEITDDYGEALYNFTIAGNPISTYCIVVPADTRQSSNLYFAADQLRKYVRMATGHNMEICYGEQKAENAVVFHQEDEEGELGIEGFIYEVKDGQLHIYGTRRGNMYAAYDILEEYLGYRFYAAYEYMTYKQRAVDIAEGTYFKKIPELNFRITRQTTYGSEGVDFFFQRRSNGRGTLSGSDDEEYGYLTGAHFINAHSFGYYYRMYTGNKIYEDQGLVWPDGPRFSERYNAGVQVNEYEWQPCFTSDESYEQEFEGMLLTIRMITEDWKNTKFQMGTSAMSFSICDNLKGMCKCDDCSTLYATDGYAGGSVYIANRAIDDIQQYYPGLKLYFIIYEHTPPKTIFPKDDLIILYCGTPCNNHYINSGECTEEGNSLHGESNILEAEYLKAWGDVCQESGAELWFWYYPVTYHYYLVGCPNIINLYYDYNYLVNECGVSGMFYEGGGTEFIFETLKEYLAMRLNWDPEMTEEEFIGHMKEYLYMYYGDGYEELYQYIMMQDEAGNGAGCFINNWDRPRQMYDYKYLDDHYEEMRALIVSAQGKAKTDEQRKRLDTLLACCDFLGLTCVHHRYYKNPESEELRQIYMERYDAMYEYIGYTTNHEKPLVINGVTQYDEDGNVIMVPGMEIFSDTAPYTFPENLRGTDRYINDPMYQFYGEERIGGTRYP